MKKLVVLALFAAITMKASAILGIELGVKAGVNSTHFTTDNYDPTGVTINNLQEDAKSGYSFGFYGLLPITKTLRFQPELYYISKSGSSDFTVNGVPTTSEIDVKSWDIPLLLNLKLLDLKVVEIYGLAGPSISFLSNPTTTNLEENYKSAAWNFQAGVGAKIWRINVDTRYEWGLSNLSGGTTSAPDFTQKSNSFQINVSFKIL